MTDKKLIACLAVAFVLRLAFVFVGFPYLQQRWQLREDGDGYGQIAQAMREGRFEDPTRGPLYSILVAAAGSPMAAKVLQSLLDTTTVLIVFTLAGRRLWAAWLWAVYPFAIWRCGFINREVLLTFLVAGYALTQVAACRDGKAARWLAAGAMLGLANLCKPTFLLWVPIALLLLQRQLSAPRVAAFLLGVGLMVASWSYAIYRATDGSQISPVATGQGGMTTYIGNYQPSLGLTEGPGRVLWVAAVEQVRQQNGGASAAELDRAFYCATWQQVRSHPAKAVELIVRKAGRFWFVSAKRRELVASILIQSGYLALLGIGLCRARPWSGETGLMVGLIMYLWLLHALTYADLRYSLPVMPLVCVLASYFNERKTAPTFSAA